MGISKAIAFPRRRESSKLIFVATGAEYVPTMPHACFRCHEQIFGVVLRGITCVISHGCCAGCIVPAKVRLT